MVLRWSAYTHPRLVRVRYAVLVTVIVENLAHRSGGSLQEEAELEIKDE